MVIICQRSIGKQSGATKHNTCFCATQCSHLRIRLRLRKANWRVRLNCVSRNANIDRARFAVTVTNIIDMRRVSHKITGFVDTAIPRLCQRDNGAAILWRTPEQLRFQNYYRRLFLQISSIQIRLQNIQGFTSY